MFYVNTERGEFIDAESSPVRQQALLLAATSDSEGCSGYWYGTKWSTQSHRPEGLVRINDSLRALLRNWGWVTPESEHWAAV